MEAQTAGFGKHFQLCDAVLVHDKVCSGTVRDEAQDPGDTKHSCTSLTQVENRVRSQVF